MFERIVLGYDGSERSRDALALTAHLAADSGGAVTVVCAFPFVGVPPADRERALAEESAPLFLAAERSLDGLAVSTRAVSDASPARALNDVAEESGADLIVIGSTHRGAAGRVFPGSVGERLLHGAPCAVAVAPSGYHSADHAEIGLIGVAYVNEPEADLALAAATDLAPVRHARLRLITVVDLRPRGVVFPDLLKEAAGEIEADLRAAEDSLAADIEHEAVLLEGDPPAELAAQGVELDLLIMGSRGYGPLGTALLGSVSAEVIRTAPCPVLVVPRRRSSNA
jgi:nucleotide-binding universal stress UspA family protein